MSSSININQTTLGQRLRGIREGLKLGDKKWTMAYVADNIGVTKGAVSQYENDENKPSADVLKSIAKLYETTIDFLLENDPDIKESHALPPVVHSQKAKLFLSELPDKDAELYVPYYDVEITAGRIEQFFDEVDEIPEGYIYAPQYRDCVACNVKGDSMYDRIFPGSRLYVYYLKNKKYIDFGHIYLVVLDGYRVLKYIDPDPADESRVILRSHNRDQYKDWPVEKGDILHLFLVKGYENQNAN